MPDELSVTDRCGVRCSSRTTVSGASLRTSLVFGQRLKSRPIFAAATSRPYAVATRSISVAMRRTSTTGGESSSAVESARAATVTIGIIVTDRYVANRCCATDRRRRSQEVLSGQSWPGRFSRRMATSSPAAFDGGPFAGSARRRRCHRRQALRIGRPWRISTSCGSLSSTARQIGDGGQRWLQVLWQRFGRQRRRAHARLPREIHRSPSARAPTSPRPFPARPPGRGRASARTCRCRIRSRAPAPDTRNAAPQVDGSSPVAAPVRPAFPAGPACRPGGRAILTAEWAGGRCWISPRNCGSAASSSRASAAARIGNFVDLALDVVGFAAPSQQKRRPVVLRHPLDVLDQPRCLSDADYQDARC